MLGERLFPLGQQHHTSFLVRVPHASGLLDGTVKPETVFAETDHRSHRVSTEEKKRQWQVAGLKKVDQLRFIHEQTGRTLGQAALQFILTEPAVASVLPNIYNEALLREFATAPDSTPLRADDVERIQELYAANFGLETPATS